MKRVAILFGVLLIAGLILWGKVWDRTIDPIAIINRFKIHNPDNAELQFNIYWNEPRFFEIIKTDSGYAVKSPKEVIWTHGKTQEDAERFRAAMVNMVNAWNSDTGKSLEGLGIWTRHRK